MGKVVKTKGGRRDSLVMEVSDKVHKLGKRIIVERRNAGAIRCR
jgi:hypothetical protein